MCLEHVRESAGGRPVIRGEVGH